ncbi:MAG: ABC transporter ATP-binding protein [Actinobacteria bacterium]|nr:ABC transporter ATP-binding protein [Actinomycetota bacterium]|tara:strand:- start:1317 stop:2090 length:774 start_codon:yes stop_codon:yes gene_type:complete
MSNIISFKDVSLSFGGVKALNNVSFDIEKGSLFAIIGPNGAGKTSLFNCISGIYKPTSGIVEYNGETIEGMRPDEIANMGVARTFQNIELFENMTVLDNILIGAHRHIDYGSVAGILYGPSVRKKELEARKIAEDIIDFLEIEEYRFSFILSLPYGIQKRVELARALAMKPEVILLDEPAAGMNNEETEDIARFILDIHEELNITTVLVDHDMNMVMDIAEYVVVMDFGQKLFEGLPKDATSNKQVIEAYLGVSSET